MNEHLNAQKGGTERAGVLCCAKGSQITAGFRVILPLSLLFSHNFFLSDEFI